MRGHKYISILIICLTVLLLYGVSSVGAETQTGLDLALKVTLSGDDSDDDGIDDATELAIARKYAPVLIFDEDEQEDVEVTVLPLFQVSPIKYSNGEEGAMLVFVFLYDDDNGADFDQGWSDWFTDPIDTVAGLIMDPFDQWFGKHCGDTEVIYFFIAKYGNWDNTRLETIYWKRHYDKIYATSDNAVNFEDLGDGNGRTHPIIYVSEDKHGMYPSHDECENYETDVVQEKLEDAAGNFVPGVLEDYIYIPVTPKMEDCSGGPQLHYAYVNAQQNVGEAKSESTKNRSALNGTLYQGYDPWENVAFWGRTDYEKICIDPAGGLGGKWCGTQYPTGSDHPCNSGDWWGSSSGSCMNTNTDRFGADYYSFLMDGYDAAPCLQACLNDPNCVSYSYVFPGYQGGDRGVCYLKNGAPDEYYNECCISGLKSDCLQ